jgi:diguanylate cyclase (GGDEF)-like protein/PAS domain S-box-containing protein
MPLDSWDRDRVAALAAGAAVCFRNRALQETPVPEWLLAGGAWNGVDQVQARIQARYHGDRAAVFDTSLLTNDRPGEVLEVRCRSRGPAGWAWEQVQFLNLLDDPEIGGVVFISRMLGEVEAEDLPPEVERSAQAGFMPEAWMVMVLDEAGTIIAAEGMVEAILGRSYDETVGHVILDFLDEGEYSAALEVWVTFLEDRSRPQTGRQRLVRADGTLIWVESTLMNRAGPAADDELILIWHDISRTLEQEAAMLQLADEFRLLAEQVPAAVFRSDDKGELTFRNSHWDTLPPLTTTSLLDLFGVQGRVELAAEMERLLAVETTGSTLELGSNDEDVTLSITLRCVGEPGSKRRAFVGSVSDISQVVSLRHRAERDPLTGLLNRRAIDEHLVLAADDDEHQTIVVFLDLDGFKAVNDEYGHDAGDIVLVEVGTRLRQAMRPGDAIGRYGGDEFVLVCPQAGPGAERAIRRRIELAFSEPILWNGGLWAPTASIGITRSAPREPIESVIRRADHAMFTIKRSHKRRAAALGAVES